MSNRKLVKFYHQMTKKTKKESLLKELLFLIIILFGFILIRSFYFTEHLNWSQDQADSAIAALKIWREKKLTLIGPQISATYDGRLLFQGPITTYLFLIFLTISNWEPIIASYLFMITAGLMIFPLYYGMKKITNQKTALISIILYSFLPYFINYTRFLWNSTFQLSSLPLLIFFFARYKNKPNNINSLIVGFFLGLLTQFHYQFLAIVFIFFIYFVAKEKINFIKILLLIFGIIIGLSPLIIFDIKHNFYNLQTAILFLKNWSKVDKPGSLTTPHYYLSISFLSLMVILAYSKNIIKRVRFSIIVFFGLLIFLYSFFVYLKKPTQSFWAPGKYWNYIMEEKAYKIIKDSNIKNNFNVADLSYYNTTASVIKYWLKRDNYQINYDDYYQNRYLFVISHNDDYEKTLSYEVAFFKPRKLIKKWSLNHYYQLYLFERQP